MDATSSSILNLGISSMTNLFVSFFTFALVHWIPVVLAIVIVAGIVAFVYGKIAGVFHGRAR